MSRMLTLWLLLGTSNALPHSLFGGRHGHQADENDWYAERSDEVRIEPREEAITLLMPFGETPAARPQPKPKKRHQMDVHTLTNTLKIEREMKKHEDYALKAIKGFEDLAQQAKDINGYWETRLKDMGKRLNYLDNQQYSHGNYIHSLNQWEQNAGRAEDYADDAAMIRDRMSAYARQISNRHLLNIRYAIKVVQTAQGEKQIDVIDKVTEISRQNYEFLIEIIRRARDGEIALNELNSITKNDRVREAQKAVEARR